MLLIVEDEKSIADILKLNLDLEGYDTKVIVDGLEALNFFRTKKNEIELLLLDVMIPGKNGFDICNEIRNSGSKVPIIFLTAKGQSEDRVRGLKSGADDYLVKPFNLEELLLRIKIVLKRNESHSDQNVYEFGANKINFGTWEISTATENKLTLTKKEIQLLKLLIEKRNLVVSRDEIIEKLWDASENASARTIDNLILNFRKYFEKNQKEPEFFHSIRGVGYKFTSI